MLKQSSITLFSAIAIFTTLYYSASGENSGYTGKFNNIFERSLSAGSSDRLSSESMEDAREDLLNYNPEDWNRYIYDPVYERMLAERGKGGVYSSEDMVIDSYGAVKLNFSYGRSYYTDSRYKQYDEDRPVSRVIRNGFFPEQLIQLHVEGGAGERIRVFIDHDSEREDNIYMMQYRAASEDEILREINAGQIDIKFSNSKYAVYDNTDAKAMGVDFTVRRDSLNIKAFGSMTRGETAVDTFRGNSSRGSTRLAEYQYLRKSYYQLEPFVRYDNVSSVPSSYTSLVAYTSKPADPATYSPCAVNISSEGFELYMDDQDQYNNINAITLTYDGGNYTRMVNGSDYSINYTTGVIHITRAVPENARIFAVYNRPGGTMDPCAVYPCPQFGGRIFVFIRYGTSLNEDIEVQNLTFDSGENDNNGDGRVNLDIYEIRSFYYMGARQLVSGSVSISFLEENSSMEGDDVTALGNYRIDTENGIINFYTREPFRIFFTGTSLQKIYSESRAQDAYVYSRYAMESSYRAEARSFQLNHSNLIESSVRVKVNGRELNASKYSVDYISGLLVFTDPSYPVIGPETEIEVKYEYLPFGSGSESFVGGLRMDYDLSRDIRIGGSFLVARGGESETIPELGSEREQTLLYEGDVSLNLGEERLADIYNLFSGGNLKAVPLAFTAYGEYARSLTTVNTFGKALIDNMESTDETVIISLSEKDWILSSMPGVYSRGLLYYKFYRDPSSPESLRGETFSYYDVDYSKKPGPYNIATGHISSSITEKTGQRSLVLDYDFSAGNCVSIVTRSFTASPVDLTGAQYIEITVRHDSTGEIDLYLDLGTVDEDSDSDTILDTEDKNGNGSIDSEPSSGYSEDRGYSFDDGANPTVVGSGPGLSGSTLGDGVLNSEDLNGNGMLDTSENVVTAHIGSIAGSAGTWQTIRIPIDPDSLSSSELEALRGVTSLRLYAVQGTGITGRVLIDNLKIVASKWKNPSLDGVYNRAAFLTTFISIVNDAVYAAESFLRLLPGLYRSLYGGEDDLSGVNETAMQIDYDVAGGSCASITRSFSRAVDIRHYRTLNLWINPRDFDAGSTIGVAIGSSENDFAEYRFVPAYDHAWEEISLKLSDDSSGSVHVYNVTGNPDFKRIKYLKVLVYGTGTSGSFWLNEIYVSEPVTLEGDAHWYECRLDIKKPLAVTVRVCLCSRT